MSLNLFRMRVTAISTLSMYWLPSVIRQKSANKSHSEVPFHLTKNTMVLMKKLLFPFKVLVGAWAVVLLCACSSITPHEAFVKSMQADIGKSTDSITWRQPNRLIGSKTMSNGNIEESYQFRRSCFYYYEIDPGSHLIVGWRFEGPESDCAIGS